MILELPWSHLAGILLLCNEALLRMHDILLHIHPVMWCLMKTFPRKWCVKTNSNKNRFASLKWKYVLIFIWSLVNSYMYNLFITLFIIHRMFEVLFIVIKYLEIRMSTFISQCSINSERLRSVCVICCMFWDFNACSKLFTNSSCCSSDNSDQHETNAALNKSLQRKQTKHHQVQI